MITILTYAEYIKFNKLAKGASATDIERYIEDATNQADNLCAGKVYSVFPTWDATKDVTKIYKVKRAIADITLLLSQTGKLYFNGSQTGGGSAPFSLNTKSENQSIEYQRQDIIANLKAAGLYGQNGGAIYTDQSGNINLNRGSSASDQLQALMKELDKRYLKLDGDNKYTSTNMLFPNGTNLQGTGDITGRDVVNPNTGQLEAPILKNYNILGSTVGEAARADMANKILDPITGLYEYINNVPIDRFDGMTKEQIYTAIAASGMIWQDTFIYRKGFIVQFVTADNKIQWAESLIDNNKGNAPETSPTAWKLLASAPIDIDSVIEQLKPFIIIEVEVEVKKELDAYNKVKVYSREQSDAKFATVVDLATANTNIQDLDGRISTVDDKADKNTVDIELKQNTLIAGENITIVGDTISSTGGGGGGDPFPGYEYKVTKHTPDSTGMISFAGTTEGIPYMVLSVRSEFNLVAPTDAGLTYTEALSRWKIYVFAGSNFSRMNQYGGGDILVGALYPKIRVQAGPKSKYMKEGQNE